MLLMPIYENKEAMLLSTAYSYDEEIGANQSINQRVFRILVLDVMFFVFRCDKSLCCRGFEHTARAQGRR